MVEIWDHRSQPAEAEDFAQIGFDHFAVGRSMAAHLIGLGHRALAYVDSGVAEDFRAHERGDGFVAEAKGRGVRVKRLRAATGDAFDAGRQMLAPLLSPAGPPITAAAFANDHLACGTLMQAASQGVAVPGRIALLGFGDFPIGRQLQPALSTVHPPTAEIGQVAAQAVLRSVGEGLDPASRALPCQLIARASTGGAAPAEGAGPR